MKNVKLAIATIALLLIAVVNAAAQCSAPDVKSAKKEGKHYTIVINQDNSIHAIYYMVSWKDPNATNWNRVRCQGANASGVGEVRIGIPKGDQVNAGTAYYGIKKGDQVFIQGICDPSVGSLGDCSLVPDSDLSLPTQTYTVKF